MDLKVICEGVEVKSFVKASKFLLLRENVSAQESLKMMVETLYECGKLQEADLIWQKYQSGSLDLNTFERKVLDGPEQDSMTPEESFRTAQRAHEDARDYFHRLEGIAIEELLVSPDEFLNVFLAGLHSNIHEKIKTLLTGQVNRVPRENLRDFLTSMGETLKLVAEQAKERNLLPQKVCSTCKNRRPTAVGFLEADESFVDECDS